MMGRCQIHPPSMDIELISQIFAAHRRTFNMPTRETHTPWSRPTHNMLRLRFYPKGKIQTATLLILSAEFACIIEQILQIAVSQYGIIVFLHIFVHIEINGSIDLISIAIVDDLLNHLDLLRNMPGRSRFDAGWQGIEHAQYLMKTQCVLLDDFHGLQLLKARLFSKLVITFVVVPLQVTCIGNISHIAYFVT